MSTATNSAPPILKDWAHKLERGLGVEMLGFPILAYDSLESTSDYLKQLAMEGAPEGLTVIAREQTRGRGQQGRTWISPRNEGVYLSVLLKPSLSADDARWLSVLVGVAVAEALQSLGMSSVTLKWPNDVLVRDRKIAGILVEPRTGRDRIHFAVAGIGVNVSMQAQSWPPELRDKATSCALEGVTADCDAVSVAVLTHLDRRYLQLKREGKAFLASAWSTLTNTPLFA